MLKAYHTLCKFANNIKSNIGYVNSITGGKKKKILQVSLCNTSGSTAGEMLALGSPGTAGPRLEQV